MPPTKYRASGFHVENCVKDQGLIYYPQAVDNITKGDVISINTAGFATNNDISTTISEFFVGIAAADSDNSTGSAGDKKLAIIPPNPMTKFWVACGTTLVAATDRGETVILATNTTLNPGTASTADWGFKIEEIDDSALAIAAVTQGFAKGTFVRATT